MRCEVKKPWVSSVDGRYRMPGTTVDVSDERAAELEAAGVVKPLDEPEQKPKPRARQSSGKRTR